MSRLVVLGLLALATVGLAQEPGPPTAEDARYGQRLLQEFELPLAVVKKYRRHQASQGSDKQSAVENTLFAKTVDWQSPVFPIDATQNPYSVVLTLTGRARADDKVVAVWLAGWSRDDDMTQQAPAILGTEGPRTAGERVIITGTILVNSFREDQERAVDLGFTRADNLDIDSVTLQVWSGLPDTNWLESVLSLRGLLVGLAVMLLLWWLRR